MKKSFFLLTAFMLLSLTTATAQFSMNVGSHSDYVVPMGDSLLFPVSFYSSTAYPAAELLVTVPDGFELLTTTPGFIGASLSGDKKQGRIAVNIPVNTNTTINVQVKALCNAATATAAAQRVIRYAAYANASATTSLATKQTTSIDNFYEPSLTMPNPESIDVYLRTRVLRILEITQTGLNAYVNNLQINAHCTDKSGITITNIEVATSATGPWTDITASGLDASQPDKYVYNITRANTFAPLGYAGQQLRENAKIYIRETVVLNKCAAGVMNYITSYGDGVTYCDPLPASAANAELIMIPQEYSPNVTLLENTIVYPVGLAQKGTFTYEIRNDSPFLAMLRDFYANVYIGGWPVADTVYSYGDYFSAYFTNALGMPIKNGNDTVFIPLVQYGATKKWKIDFSQLNNPALSTYYTARGLTDNDGDGMYNDIPTSVLFYITVVWNVNFDHITDTVCRPQLFSGMDTYSFDISFKDACDTEKYVEVPMLSTSKWNYSLLHKVMMGKSLLAVNEATTLSFNIHGSDFFDNFYSNAHFIAEQSITPPYNSTYKVKVTLPDGLDYDPSVANPVRINNTDVEAGLIEVIDSRNIIITNRIAISNYTITVAVKANGASDPDKIVSVENHLLYGNVAPTYKWGCISRSVPYATMTACDDIELTHFAAERTTFGYTDITKSARITKAAGANVHVAYPYDNVQFDVKTVVHNPSIDVATDRLNVRFSYSNPSSTSPTAYYLEKEPGRDYPGEIIVKKAAAPAVPISIAIPADSITTGFVAATRIHSLQANIAPLLNNNGITPEAGDSIEVVFYLRTNNNLPEDIASISTPVTAEVVRVSNGSSYTCVPLYDVQFKCERQELTEVSSSPNISGRFYYENDINYQSSWYCGSKEYSFWYSNLTAGEYRPTADNFSRIQVKINSLIRINGIDLRLMTQHLGNEFDRLLDTSEYTVSYNNGYTIVDIDPLLDAMVATQYYIGYYLTFQWESINLHRSAVIGISDYVQTTFSQYAYSTSEQPKLISHTNENIGMNYGEGKYYSYTLRSAASTQTPTPNIAEWTLTLTNTSNWSDPELPNSWMAFEVPDGVTPYKLIDAVTNAVIADIANAGDFMAYTGAGGETYYWVKLGNIEVVSPKQYKLQCTYNICSGSPSFPVKFAMSKIDYPTDPYQSFSNYNSSGMPIYNQIQTTLNFTPPQVDFSGLLTHRPNEPDNKNRFCDTVGFTAMFRNNLSAEVSNLRLHTTLPAGFDYDTTVPARVRFGTSPVWIPVQSVAQVGRNLDIRLSATDKLTAYGTSGEVAYVDFRLKTTCGIENYTLLSVDFVGESDCGAERIKNYNSKQISIAGLSLPPDYFIQNLYLTQSPLPGDDRMILTGTLAQTAPAEVGMKALITLPENLMLDSVISGLAFTQSGRRLSADLPATPISPPWQTYNINLVLKPVNPWSMDSSYIYVRTGKIIELTCNGESCPIFEFGEHYEAISVSLKNIQVKFSNLIEANSYYNDPNSERVTVDGKLVNFGDTDADRVAIDWCYFDGVNYVPLTNVVSDLTVNNILNNDSVAFRISADVQYIEDACNLFLVLRKDNTTGGAHNPYLTAEDTIRVPVPIYKISAIVDPICQTADSATIGELPIRGYTYKYTPSLHLSHDSITPTVFNYDEENYPVWNDTTLRYRLAIKRPNGCISIDALPVPVKALAYVQQEADRTLCSGEPFSVTFSDTLNTLGNTTFSWTIENGIDVGLPASGNTAVIDAAEIHNNTTLPIILKIQVTPTRNGCEGVTKTFSVTVNPLPTVFVKEDTVTVSDSVHFVAAGKPAFTYSYDITWRHDGAEDNMTRTFDDADAVTAVTVADIAPTAALVGTYTFRLTGITDASGCTAAGLTDTLIVLPNASSTFTPLTIPVEYVAGMTVGDVPLPEGYAWNTPGTRIAPRAGIQSYPAIYDSGNPEYLPANGTIDLEVSINAKLKDLTADGALSPTFSPETTDYTLALSCDKILQVTTVPSSGGYVHYTLDSLPATLPKTFDNPGTATLTVYSVGADSITTIAYKITVMIPYNSDIIRPYWNDVLAVNLNPANNGGYVFRKYEWVKDDVLLTEYGDNHPYLYQPEKGWYSAYLTTEDGLRLSVCPFYYDGQMHISALMVYPNPTNTSATVVNPEWQTVKTIELYNSIGAMVRQYACGSRETIIDLWGLRTGWYVLKAGKLSTNLVID
ncbi:MAG: T9SS type A sorting domain-containing protein [Prevotellaceae bacterium]|jgi:hypothetical protein|nr:T9SS type A sorting domain-containing protein [Prevotellaceae bacterium]